MAQYQTFPDAAGDSLTLDKLKALRLPDLSGKSMLDVGCNEGFFCGFAQHQGAAKVTGIDQSAHFIARARERFPGCTFLQQGWDALPPGQFDVILLASALHYAEDQPALLQSLVDRLTEDGTLVLELGIASSREAEWVKVDRGIDERLFPSMPMLRKVLAGYAWKWMGPSVQQQGDPVQRHVVHIRRRRPMAYLLMQPPGYGKSSIAGHLFPRAKIPVVSGDARIAAATRKKGKVDASPPLKAMIAGQYSPFHIDRLVQAIFDADLGEDLVDLWLPAKKRDFALDAYVPADRQAFLEQAIRARGYLPVKLDWQRVGEAPLPIDQAGKQAEDFYLSLSGMQDAVAPGGGQERRWQPLGFVDEIVAQEGKLLVRGWAIDAQGRVPDRIVVRFAWRDTRTGPVERCLRPDVQRHLGLAHALVGFRLSVDAPGVRSAQDLGSGFRVSVGAGEPFELAGALDSIFRCEGSEQPRLK